MNQEKLCLNLSFTVENKTVNLHKSGHISDFSSNFKNISMNWDVFHWEKVVLILLLLYAQLAFTCSTLTTETLEQGVKYALS